MKKRITSIILAALLALSAIPFASLAEHDGTAEALQAFEQKISGDGYAPRQINSESIVIDDDPEGGYEGNYVVIYNPSESASSSMSTGDMSGLIKTTISPNVLPSVAANESEDDGLYVIDIDPLMEEATRKQIEAGAVLPEPERAVSYNVGDRKTFSITSYSPQGSSMEFTVLAVGNHCYVWTPTSTASNVYPLDANGGALAEVAAAEFDSKYALMNTSFGDHYSGSGDGKVNILFYNIDDGWQPGQGYVAGYFYGGDFFSPNSLPIIHIDTYPGVYQPDQPGTLAKARGTMVHEYQHMIHYSQTYFLSGNSHKGETWLNECMSAAAEEICYPGSSIHGRIPSWTGSYSYSNPPREFHYNPNYELHKGYSMYSWSNSIAMDDSLALYAQVSLFAQYIYTQSDLGNAAFKAILEKVAEKKTFQQVCPDVLGMSSADFVRNYRIALTANTSSDLLGGLYHFELQDGYDNYNGVDNPYKLLGPIVFTGSSCSIKGGGAITVKPVDGVYNPPAGANAQLKYFGITVPQGEESSIWDFEIDPVSQGFIFIDSDGDGYNWDWINSPGAADAGWYFHEGDGFMSSASYSNDVGALSPDNWMITPEFTGDALTFWAQAQDPSWSSEYLGIFVSADGGNTWSDELAGFMLTGDDTQYTVNLSAYSGQTVKAAIRHYNTTDMFRAHVDYIEITAPEAPEGGFFIEHRYYPEADGMYTSEISACTTSTYYKDDVVVRDYLTDAFTFAAGENLSVSADLVRCQGLDEDGVPQFSLQGKDLGTKALSCTYGRDSNGYYWSFTGFDFSDYVCSESGGYKLVIKLHGLLAADDAVGTFSASKHEISGAFLNGSPICSFEPCEVEIPERSVAYDFGSALRFGGDAGGVLSIEKNSYPMYTKEGSSYNYNSAVSFDACSVSLADGTAEFTPGSINTEAYSVNALLRLESGEYEWSRLTFIPATVVLYEESFGTFTNGSDGNTDAPWSMAGSPSTAEQNANDGVFGYSSNYAALTGDSNGSAMKATVDNALYRKIASNTPGAKWPSADFAFTGTGLDIVTRCGIDTGILAIDIVPKSASYNYCGENSAHVVIDTYFSGEIGDADIGDIEYQVPVLSKWGLSYGEYKVRIRALYVSVFDNQPSAAGFDPASIPGIENVNYDFIQVSPEAKREQSRAKGSFTSYIDGIRVYNPLGVDLSEQAYAEANELNPNFINLRNALKNGLIEPILYNYDDSSVTEEQYDEISPKNELFIRHNKGIAFSVSSGCRVHLSLKSPTGEGFKLEINGTTLKNADGNDIVIGHTSELYYDITDYVVNGNVSLVCKSVSDDASPVLSIVNVKLVPIADEGHQPYISAGHDTVEFVEALYFGIMGDANHDGSVSMIDALFALRHAIGGVELDIYGKYCADINSNGSVDASDALAIMRLCM